MTEELSTVGVAEVRKQAVAVPLLASRLSPAPLPETVVVRPRLLRRLDDGAGGPVTLVSAPAGWGKTTLLASWVRAVGTDPAPAWLSVEAGDTAQRLWSYLAAALRSATAPAPGEAESPAPDTPPRPDQLELLAAALATREQPVVLVLDDLHRITDPAALAGLEFMIRHCDQRLRLVIGARTDLPLALHRLRLSGELTELGTDDLAFTTDEVADLLTVHGVQLPAAAVRRLQERTGGWSAGLRFAALALPGHPDPVRYVEQFAGDQPDVAGYLHEEVLAALGGDAVDVLRRTAVADAVCGNLVDALTGRADGEQLLAGLARDSGFLRQDDTRPPWYRCQPLLADLLRAELARIPGDELRDLHRRAAGWYAGNGRPAEALRHALVAREWDMATELFIERWPELLPYDLGAAVVAPPVVAPAAPPAAMPSAAVPSAAVPSAAVPPPEAIRRDPELALACAAERAQAGDAAAVREQLRLAADAARTLPGPRRDRFRRLATALELTLARLVGDHEEVRAAAARLLGTVTVASGPGDDPRSGTADDADVRAAAGTARGLVDLADGDLRGAGVEFDRALAAAGEAGRPRTGLVCASRSALLAAVRGELRAAERTAREALAMPSCRGWSCRVDHAHAYLALAVVAIHRDEAEEAETNLDLAAPAANGYDPTVAAVAAMCRAQLLRDRSDPAASHRLLAQGREPLVDRPRSRELINWLLAAEADLSAARGDPDTARDLLGERLGQPAEPVEALAVALARVELRAGDIPAAGYALPDWDGPEAARWPLPVRLDAGVLDAVLAQRGGDARRAGRVLERVLELAEPEGFRRVFTRAEPSLRDLLAAHLDSGTAHWPMVSDLVRGTDEPAERATAVSERVLAEQLTERELTILRYLQSILSNVEIASELSLSVNTVKTHVRNIYRKLDATRRREAVRRARELRLI